MVKITSQSLARATERAKAIHPRVIFVRERQFKVISPRSGKTYFVRFEKHGSEKVGYCSCQAGVNNIACYHLASAFQANLMVASMRQAPKAYTLQPFIGSRFQGIDI